MMDLDRVGICAELSLFFSAFAHLDFGGPVDCNVSDQ